MEACVLLRYSQEAHREYWLFFDQLSVCGNEGASEVFKSITHQNLQRATIDFCASNVSTHLRFKAFAANFKDALKVANGVALMNS